MGKLGKKARKFAKKNLQSVLKRKRKIKSTFKKKASKKDQRDAAENEEENAELSARRNSENGDIEDMSLEAIFSEDESDEDEGDVDVDDSGSDGYLSEDSNCLPIAESEIHLGENGAAGKPSAQNQEILLELENKKKKLSRLKAKDPGFSKFLESHDKGLKSFRNENAYSDEDERSDDGMQSMDEDGPHLYLNKLLTSSAINSWCHLVKEQHNASAFISLLNAYRAACHYGAESTGILGSGSGAPILDCETFCKILMFVLREADDVFREMLGISSNCKRDTILGLKNNSKWKTVRPLIKSYLRSTLFMLNQATDSEILAFSLNRLRTSIVFFAAFPLLIRRLIKIGVHLWATGEETVSFHSFLILQDVASGFSSDCFDLCLIKMYKAFIGHCKFAEPALFKHLQFLRNSFVELCSQDLLRSSNKAKVSINNLSRILQLGLQTKKKEAVKKICSWQYANCIDLWVTYISHCIHDYDLQPLLYIIIQIINGMATLFPGPRYLPLRRKCIEWLNHLSSSSGIFIPVTSLVLDVLEYKVSKEVGKPGKDFNFSSAVKLPKHWLKSRNFREDCVFSAIELLSAHFAQWSYHISFPELATIPLIHLRKFQEKSDVESLRRVVKRFIDVVEQNIEFVKKKRDEVAFSPNDQQSVEAFLQLEKCSGNTPFTQYYRSVMEKAASRSLIMNENKSFLEQKKQKRKRGQNIVDVRANGEKVPEKSKVDQAVSVNDGK
ncbi:Noc2p family [Citrus sinensis]|uniref:Noc2p family n=1 Tax=Citrus sinensis TaxID=2711 RepID=A0ACB8L4H8_CITSI|nr:Noc2p family [Citrus sinensis]